MSAHVVCGLIGNVVGTTHISANEAGHFDVKEEEDFTHIINNDNWYDTLVEFDKLLKKLN